MKHLVLASAYSSRKAEEGETVSYQQHLSRIPPGPVKQIQRVVTLKSNLSPDIHQFD